jgi:predicted NAD/FAD-binding protein
MRIAVIGSGIAGLGTAWALGRGHEVVIYEAADYLGGHAHTVDIEDAGRTIAVDTGFIVYNEANYPNLTRLFDVAAVPTEPSDMSFSVSVGHGAFEYQGRLLGLAAQPSNLARPSYLRMVGEILRFTREARELIGAGSRESTGDYLARQGYSAAFRDDYLLPMVACIWSSHLEAMLDYPAETMVRFLDNHGLLQVRHRPLWRTVTGGSREYVRRVIASSTAEIRLSTPVVAIRRDADGVTVIDGLGHRDRFDHAVMATHADTTLAILGEDAAPEEARTLGAFRYQENLAVLHRDPSLMPRRRAAWSSWNYLAETRGQGGAVSLSYWMNRLQNLETERPVIVTLNPPREPREAVDTFVYHHPQYDRAAVDAQARIPGLQGRRRTWFAGAYCGFGFHEDGLRAGLDVAAGLGAPAPWWPRTDLDERPIVPSASVVVGSR